MSAWWLLAGPPITVLGLVLAAARLGSRTDTPPDDGIDAARQSGLFPALNTEET